MCRNLSPSVENAVGLHFVGILPPSEVKDCLLSKFAEKQSGTKKPQYCLPMRMKDKIRLHLLVLCLIIDDFSVPCSVLQKDLKITEQKYGKGVGKGSFTGKGSLSVQTLNSMTSLPINLCARIHCVFSPL